MATDIIFDLAKFIMATTTSKCPLKTFKNIHRQWCSLAGLLGLVPAEKEVPLLL
jgi:hypothetical protein